MGERAKITINEPIAIGLIKKDNLDLDKFYSADLKIFIKAASKEIKRLENIISKAIEYIRNNDFLYDKQYIKHDKLLQILEGSDKE